MNLNGGTQRFALLLDFFPAATGRRGSAFTLGEQFKGEVVFYRAARPLRAVIAERQAMEGAAKAWGMSGDADPLAGFVDRLEAAPWSLASPILMPAGRICEEPSGQQWWRAADGDATLPLDGDVKPVALGIDLSSSAGIWTGTRLTMLAGQSDWGRLSFDA